MQKVNRLVPGPGQTRAAWSVLDDLARRMGGDLGAPSAEALAKEIERVAPAYHGVSWDLLDWGAGREGIVLPVDRGVQHLEYIPVYPNLQASTAKYSLHLGRVLYDDGVRTRMSPSLAALAPEAAVTYTWPGQPLRRHVSEATGRLIYGHHVALTVGLTLRL